jgi:Mg-chelatase subunit ChlD
LKRTPPDAAAAFAAALGTILVGVGAWLFVPRERDGAKPTLPALRVCLVDVSASAYERRSRWYSWSEDALENQKGEAERHGEDFCTILFGYEVRRDFGPAPARTFPKADMHERRAGLHGLFNEDDAATRLAEALEAARGLTTDPARGACTVVVIGDGTYTGRDPVPVLRDLRDRGVVLQRLDPPAADRTELTVGALVVPREVEEGAPIAVECDLFYAPGARETARPKVTLEVTNNFSAGHRSEQVEVPVPPGLSLDPDGYLGWRGRFEIGRSEPGLNAIDIGPAEPNWGRHSSGFVRSRGRLIVGWAGWGRDRPAVGSSEGLDLQALSPMDLADRLDSLDAVVTCDLPPSGLPKEILNSFVRRGGGWLCFAGDDLLPGFVTGSPIVPGDPSALLPLIPPDDKQEPRDIVLLVDRSGSMAGEAFENVRRAVLALIERTPSRDAVELRFFSDRMSEPIPLKGIDDRRDGARVLREAADRFLAEESPGGSTAIARSLEAFAAQRERGGREALAFLLTDGRDTVDPDAKERCSKIRERLLAAHARLVVIAAGEDPDRALLTGLVGGDDELHPVGSLIRPGVSGDLEKIFRREVSKDRVRAGESLRVLPFSGLLDPSAPPSLGADVLHSQKPEQSDRWPTIQRYVRARAAPGAEVLWSSERGEPLLAIQRVGLGTTAACAFALIPGWGAEWSRRGDLWAPLLRAIARGHREVRPRVRLDEDELSVEDLPVDAPAELEARIFPAGAGDDAPPAVVITLSAPTQGGDPRRVRRGTWPRDSIRGVTDSWDEGTLEERLMSSGVPSSSMPRVEIRARGDSDSKWLALELPFAPPHAPEFVLPRPRLNPGDLFAPGPGSDPSAHSRPLAARSPRAHPAAPWVLISGLLLLTFAGLFGFFSRRAR